MSVRKFPFGLDRERLTEQFEAITAGLKSGEVIPQAVTYSEDEIQDDFQMRTVTLKFAMKGATDG
jgi:hypothetical protein